MPKYALPHKFSPSLVLLDELPSGASGHVYRAQYTYDGRVMDVVVKFFDHPATHEMFGYFTNEQVVLRTLSQTFAHPHLVQYVKHNLTIEPFFVVTQYVSGAYPLSKLRASDRSPALLTHIIQQVADALDYLHEGKHTYKPVIHRDVKPDNILLDTHNNAVLIDLSIARHPHFSISDDKIMGTPAYMSPEQYEGNEVPASDQFSLAAIAYELLAGHPLFARHAQKAQQQLAQLYKTEFARVRSVLGAQYPATTDVLCKALAYNPEERYLTCIGFSNAFRDALQSDGKRVYAPIQVSTRRNRHLEWKRWIIPVAAVLAVLLLGGAVLGATHMAPQFLGIGANSTPDAGSRLFGTPGATSTLAPVIDPSSIPTVVPSQTIDHNGSLPGRPSLGSTATLAPIPSPTPIPTAVLIPTAAPIPTSNPNQVLAAQQTQQALNAAAAQRQTAAAQQAAQQAAAEAAAAEAAEAAAAEAAAEAAAAAAAEAAAAEAAAQQATAEAARWVIVPQVWGNQLSTAIGMLQAAGLGYAITYYGDSNYPDDYVSNAIPNPGTQVERGTTITLSVVRNPRGGGGDDGDGGAAESL